MKLRFTMSAYIDQSTPTLSGEVVSFSELVRFLLTDSRPMSEYLHRQHFARNRLSPTTSPLELN